MESFKQTWVFIEARNRCFLRKSCFETLYSSGWHYEEEKKIFDTKLFVCIKQYEVTFFLRVSLCFFHLSTFIPFDLDFFYSSRIIDEKTLKLNRVKRRNKFIKNAF